jgi:hypothetical protein
VAVRNFTMLFSRLSSTSLAASLVAVFLLTAAPHAARADVTAKFHDANYGTDLVLIANVGHGAKQAALGITKDNSSPVVLFPNLATWTQFADLWRRAKAAPASDQKQKIGTFIDQDSGNVMGIDVNKDGIFFFITDSSTTQLFVLKKADQSKFDDDVDNVTLFLSH